MLESENSHIPILRNIEFFAFGKEIKRQTRTEQDNICAMTGIKSRRLDVHHRLPVCKGGSDRIENAIGVLGEKDVQDVHEKYDRLAVDHNLFLHPDGRLVTRDEMPDECFKFKDHGMPIRRERHRKRGKRRR